MTNKLNYWMSKGLPWYHFGVGYLPLKKIKSPCKHGLIMDCLIPVIKNRYTKGWEVCLASHVLGGFCPTCGYIPMYHLKEGVDFRIVKAGTLAETGTH